MTLRSDPRHFYKRHLQCAEQQRLPSNITNILRLPRKMTIQNFKEISRKLLKRHLQCGADPRSENEPRVKNHHAVRNPPRNRGYFSRSPRAFSNEKCNFSHSSYPRLLFALTTSIFYWKIQHFALQLSFQNFTKCCTCHEKWHLNFTKYCACHEKWHSTLLYSTLLYPSLLHSTPHSTPHSTTLLYSTRLFSTLLYPSLLHSTPLHSTLLYYSLLFATLLYSTQLFSTIRYSTRLFYHLWLYYSLTLLFLTLRSRSYIGSFSSKLPLIKYVISFFHQPPLSWWINMEHIGRRWSEQPWVNISVKT